MIAKYAFWLMVLKGVCLCQQVDTNVPSSSIVGLVTSADGAPLMSKVFAYQIVTKDGLGHPIAACSSETSEDGKYACVVSPGRYILLAQPRLSSSKPLQDTSGRASIAIPRTVTSAYPTGFYPNATSLSDTQAITLKPGEYRTANIAINQRRAEDIKGSIPGKPKVARIHLSLHGEAYDLPSPFTVTYDAETGSFISHNVPEGEYLLEAYWFANGATRYSSRVVTGGAGAKDIVLRENALVHVRGMITMQSGVAGKPPSSISLRCGSWGAQQRYSSLVADDGSFDIPAIPVSQCSLAVASTNNSYVRSAVADSRNLPLSYFSLTPPSMKMEIEMSNKTGELQGTITDIPSGTVEAGVVAQSADSGEVTAVRVDSKGTFAISDLPVGSYMLYALPDLANSEYRNSAYLHLLENDGVNVAIKADQSVSVGLQITPAARRALFEAAN